MTRPDLERLMKMHDELHDGGLRTPEQQSAAYKFRCELEAVFPIVADYARALEAELANARTHACASCCHEFEDLANAGLEPGKPYAPQVAALLMRTAKLEYVAEAAREFSSVYECNQNPAAQTAAFNTLMSAFVALEALEEETSKP